MSRNTLLGQSLVRNANALNFSDSDPNYKHWKRDWYTPLRTPQLPSTVVTPSATPTPFGDEATPQAEQKYTFQVKTWVPNDSYTPLVDGDEDDVLDLDRYSTVKVHNENGLTDAAIRGAVATEGDSIPGLSKSTDAAAAATASSGTKTEDTTVADSSIATETTQEIEEKMDIDEPKEVESVEAKQSEPMDANIAKPQTSSESVGEIKTESPLKIQAEEDTKPEEAGASNVTGVQTGSDEPMTEGAEVHQPVVESTIDEPTEVGGLASDTKNDLPLASESKVQEGTTTQETTEKKDEDEDVVID